MTPFRSHGRGTLVLKGTFGGIHVERASGTHDATMLRRLSAMMDTLADTGRLDVIQCVAVGTVRPLELWRQYRGGDWSHLPTAEDARPAKEAMEGWRARLPGERHRGDVATSMRALLEGAPKATLAQLPTLMEGYRARCEAAGTCRMFNKVKSHAQSFLRKTLTRSHLLYKAVRDIELLPVTPKRAKHPQSPDEARTIAAVLGGEAGRIWWTLCCTGMGPDEYFGDKWRVEDGVLHVLGTKRRGRNRLVPLLVTPEPPMLAYWGFREALRRSGLGVAPYDARRTFANWMEQAGLWETHQQAYMGHGARTVTDLYRWHDVTRFLERDRRKLLAFIGGISGGTGKTPKAGSSSAPPVNRTRNLLIKSRPRRVRAFGLTRLRSFTSSVRDQARTNPNSPRQSRFFTRSLPGRGGGEQCVPGLRRLSLHVR